MFYEAFKIILSYDHHFQDITKKISDKMFYEAFGNISSYGQHVRDNSKIVPVKYHKIFRLMTNIFEII
jgi:hypothetical protein